PSGSVIMACDLDAARAQKLAAKAGCRHTTDADDAVNDPAVQSVIVATINAALAPVTEQAIRAGKNVLVEKPAGLNSRELSNLQRLAKKHRVLVRVGFNHR